MDNSFNGTDLRSLTPQEVNISVLQVVGKSDPVDYQDHRGLKGKDRDGLFGCILYRERDDYKNKYWAQDRSELVHEPEGRLHQSVEYIVTGYVLIVEEREEGDP